MKSCECIKNVKMENLEIHPGILSVITLKELDYLMQDKMTALSYKAEASNLIHVVKKKGMRKNSRYYVLRGIGTYYAHKRLLEMGELSHPKVIDVTEKISDETVQKMFLFECTAFKRTATTNGVVALVLKRVSESRNNNQRPSLIEPHIKDVSNPRAKTLRQITGYDGRAFQNAIKNENPPISLLQAIKEWK